MIGIISDIHGNYPALKAVLDILSEEKCNKIISLGDVAGYYCDINECIELLRERNVENIMGNHDYYLVSDTRCPRSHSANLCLDYQRSTITKDNMEWLKKSREFIDTINISFRHGGWQDCKDEYIYSFNFDLVKGREEKIYVSGHTHIQTILQENNKVYFNPGSVGQPRDYSPTAAFALIDEENGYNISLRRTEYDIDCIINKMQTIGFPSKISECLLKGTKIGEIL